MNYTSLTFEGISPDEVTAGFLVDLLDGAEDHDLDVAGIGVDRHASRGEG